ncbi:hypothetical protein G7046_g9397 [Stylonectria norvegica]|nr:hypothetical protein G7046_g9397 [Stylonectria norvegica]
MAEDWKTRASAKRQAILDSLPQKWRMTSRIPDVEEQRDVTGSYIRQFLSPREIEITETDAVGIAEQTTTGRWSAVEVVEAFCHRASLAHQLVNCLHETFFDAAIRDAQALDKYLADNKKPVGPLHGVPVSLKDQFHVKDVETTMGYVGWIDTFEGHIGDPRQKTFESEMVRELRDLGAVLYCKTSVPHTLMTGETVNNIVGYTWNPKNRNLSPGGSSGGEGALIGLRGSPLGLGTDIGGSIRIPAAFNGLYGLRPSAGRLPYEGMANSLDGQNSVLSVVGPLATTPGSLKLIVKSLLSQNPWHHDPMVVEMPWRDAEEQAIVNLLKSTAEGRKGQLTFGLMRGDETVNANPPVLRALNMLAEALQKAGHQVIEWEPPSHKPLLALTFGAWTFDGGADVQHAFGLSGEPSSTQVHLTVGSELSEERTASHIAATNVKLRQYKKKYLEYWNSTASLTATGRPVDGVIAPLAPFPAARPNQFRYYGLTAWVNGLDLTTVAVPVTIADKAVDKYEAGYTPISDDDKFVYEDYDAEIYDGAHVGVQIVGRRFTEEKMIAIAEYVGTLLGK